MTRTVPTSTDTARLTGVVTSVRLRLIGSTLTAAAALGATALTVGDNVDMRPGDTVRLLDTDTGATVVVTVAAVAGTTGVTLTAVLAAAWPAATLVLLEPAAAEVTAFVRLTDDTEPIPARIAHALGDAIAVGTRDETTAETVVLERDGTGFLVVDVIARDVARDARKLEARADYADEIPGRMDTTVAQPLFFLSSGTLPNYGITTISPSQRATGELAPRVRLQSGPIATGGHEPSIEIAARYIMISDITSNIDRIEVYPASGSVVGSGLARFQNVYVSSVPTTTSAANCRMNIDGRLVQSTSTRRLKKQIRNAVVDVDAVLKVRPRTWISKAEGDEGEQGIGVIAEEVEDLGLGQFVDHGPDGQAVGFHYDRFATVALLAALQQQHSDIGDLRRQVADQQEQITRLVDRVNGLPGAGRPTK